MARPPRIDRENGLYHVTARGNGRARVFLNTADYERFLAQLADNGETYGCVVHAYAVMDNHFHLLVRTPRANLSRFMQRLVTSYALYARYRHKKPGHQFQGRFKAKLIESDRYLRQVSCYIHLNPIRIKACARLTVGERLKRLRTYRWSSYRGYLNASDAEGFVQSRDVVRQFGSGRAAREAYRRYVESCVARWDEETVEAMNASPYVIGSEGFAGQIEAELAARRSGQEKDVDVGLPRRAVTFEAIDARVARRFGMDKGRLTLHGKAAGTAKAVAVELACVLTGQSQRAVGARYGGITSSAVGKIRAADQAGKGERRGHGPQRRPEEILRSV